MKTELKEVSPIEREIKIEIEAEAVREVYNKVSQKYAKMANVPGFRKGNAPLDVVRLRYREDIKNEVVRELLPLKVTAAIEEYGLMPLADPHLHFDNWEKMKVNGSEPLTLHIHFEIMPEIPVPEYKGIEAVRRVKPLDGKEVENLIDNRRQEFASLIPVEGRKSAEGDTVIVDLEGIFVDGSEDEPIILNDLEIKLGDQSIEQSFTENLLGVSEDEEKEFTVSYPEGFAAPTLSGKTVNYKARIKSIGRVELPELDDEWAQSLDEGYESMADLQNQLTKDLETVAKSQADIRVRNDLINKLIQTYSFPIPNPLIESQARNLLDNFARDMANRGFDLKNVGEDFVKMAYEQMRRQAEFDVRGAMLLDKIAELENIAISDEEIAEEIDKMADYYGVPADQIRQQNDVETSISNSLRTRKAVEAVFEQAVITDGEWIDENQALPEIETAETETSEPEIAETEAAEAETAEVEEASVKKAKKTDEKPKKKAAKKEK